MKKKLLYSYFYHISHVIGAFHGYFLIDCGPQYNNKYRQLHSICDSEV